MTLAELILSHNEMGLGTHDEVLIAYRSADDLLVPCRIIAIESGYLLMQPIMEEVNVHLGK